MKFYLMPNPLKDVAIARAVVARLAEHGAEIYLPAAQAGQFGDYPVHLTRDTAPIADCDMVISIGGDGSIIRAARVAIPYQKPVVGVNAGRMGFLARIESDQLHLLDRLFRGEYSVSRRMIFDVTVTDGPKQEHCFAINDVVISNALHSKMADLQVSYDGTPTADYRADGIIFATPTGTTAYSLSAGGPIVYPSVEAITMTPISPHSLISRSFVFPPESRLTVQSANSAYTPNLHISIDGAIKLDTTDPAASVEIKKSSFMAQFIQFDEVDFYRTLKEKIISNS